MLSFVMNTCIINMPKTYAYNYACSMCLFLQNAYFWYHLCAYVNCMYAYSDIFSDMPMPIQIYSLQICLFVISSFSN